LRDAGYPGGRRCQEQSWYRFLKSHGRRIFACDFLTVETAFLQRLYVFSLMDTSTREIIAIAVTKNPTSNWLETILRNAFIILEDYPAFLVSDRDGIYGEWFGKFLKDCYGITLYRTPPRTPNCNTVVERWNRTLRIELLDHRIIFGQRDLRRLLQEYVQYYNKSRPHQSLDQDSPCKKHGNIDFERSKIRRKRVVDGLFVDYSIAA
jgi:putative transposase